MRICEAAATEGTGHAQAVDDESQSMINHIALKIARRAHKLHGRRRNTDNCGRIFTAHGLRARHPVLDSAAARAQLDVAVRGSRQQDTLLQCVQPKLQSIHICKMLRMKLAHVHAVPFIVALLRAASQLGCGSCDILTLPQTCN